MTDMRIERLLKKHCLMDLHMHLDGSLSPSSAAQLAALEGIEIPENRAALCEMLSVSPDCRDLNTYLEKFAFPARLLQTEKAITFAVSTLLSELWSMGVGYAEIRFAPQKHTEKGMAQREVICAAIRGLSGQKCDGGLILCCMRGDDTKEQNLETVRLAAEFLGTGVVACDLAGAEGLYPTRDFSDVFEEARRLSVPFTLHAGEADGPESVRTALSFGAARIGHGVRAAEDPSLLKSLRESGICLEICPSSNLQTRVFPSLSDFPIRTFLDAGVRFTICTDNTAVSATSLPEEWAHVLSAFTLSDAEIRHILLSAADAAFCTAEKKEKLRASIRAAF